MNETPQGPTRGRRVLGLDIGGSKTHAMLASAQTGENPGPAGFAVIDEAVVPGANILSVGQAKAESALAQAAAKLGHPMLDAVVAGAAGADSAQSLADLHSLIVRHFPATRVEVVHDSRIILAAAGLEAGTVLIAGTGSVAWGRRPDGAEARAGGLGHLLGDEGSGYALVRDAVRAVLLAQQGGERRGALARRLALANGLTDPAGLLDAFYDRQDRRHWAAQSTEVLTAAAEGDPLAAQVLADAAAALAALVLRVRNRLHHDGPVVLAGGLLTHGRPLAELVTGHLAAAGLPEARILEGPPVLGAVALAATADRPATPPSAETPDPAGSRANPA